jgi:hypothetical protein
VNVFISHAVVDAAVVESLVDLICMGTGVNQEDVFCSSIGGLNSANGSHFVPDILQHLNSAEVIVAVLSPSYVKSEFCLAEAGAAYLRSQVHKSASLVLLLVQPADYEDFNKGVFHGLQLGRMDDADSLDELRDIVAKHFSKHLKTSIWNNKRAVFLRQMQAHNARIGLEESLKDIVIQRVDFLRDMSRGITFKSKVNVHLKNMTGKDIRMKGSEWSPGAKLQRPIPRNSVFRVFLGENNWSQESAEILVGDGQTFSLWIGLDSRQSDDELREMRENHRLGLLKLTVSIAGSDFVLTRQL